MREPRTEVQPPDEAGAAPSPDVPAGAPGSAARELAALDAGQLCQRCHGLLVRDVLLGKEDEASLESWSWCLRCLNCGEVVDALIMRHRWFGSMRPPTSPAVTGHGWPTHPTSVRACADAHHGRVKKATCP